MAGAGWKEGLRAPLFLFALIAATVAAGPLWAQDVVVSDLALCAGLETAELKLACFEALAATAGQEDETVAPPATRAPAAASAATAAGVAAAVNASDGDSVAPDEAAIADAEPANATETADAETIDSPPDEMPAEPAVGPPPADIGAEKPDAASSVAPVAAGAAVVESVPEADPMPDLGKEDIETEEDVVIATVVDVTKEKYGILYFYFENGQVWRQAEKRHFPYPRDGSFEVEIDTGMMGDYQMRVGGEGRMTRIKRVE